jgi:hypothetical protein
MKRFLLSLQIIALCGIMAQAENRFAESAKIASFKTDMDPEIQNVLVHEFSQKLLTSARDYRNLSDEEIDSLQKGYESLNVMRELKEKLELKINKENRLNAGFVSLGLGVYGVATFVASGGLYPAITGAFFMYSAYANISNAIAE